MDTQQKFALEAESPTAVSRIHRMFVTMAALIFQSVTIGVAILALLLAVVNEIL